MNANYAAKVKEEIDKLLREGFIRPVVVKIFDNSVKIAWNEGNREDAICTRMKGVMVRCVC